MKDMFGNDVGSNNMLFGDKSGSSGDRGPGGQGGSKGLGMCGQVSRWGQKRKALFFGISVSFCLALYFLVCFRLFVL